MTQKIADLSVVIATLGGDSLAATVACIKQSTTAPKEILICIPQDEANKVRLLEDEQTHILVTKERGQVAQRAEGFRNVKSNLVLQMDDDVMFSPTTIQTMIQHLLNLGAGHVVGPIFCDDVNHQPIARFDPSLKGILKSAYFTLVAGLPWGLQRMGKFSSVTCAISLDPQFAEKPLQQAQWLAGGFVLGFQQDLVFENFYPVSGKAYAEDLLHSKARYEKGVRHVVATEVMVSTKPQSDEITWGELSRELKARRMVAKHLGALNPRATFFFAMEQLKRAIKATLRAC